MTDKEYIIKRLDNQIAWYSKKSSVNQKWYKWLKRFEIILSISIPVGTMILWSCPEGKIIIAVSSAIVTLLGTWQSTFKYAEYWKSYRETAEVLKHIKFLYATHTEPYNSENPDEAYALLVQHVESVTCHENKIWTSSFLQSKKDKK